MDFGLEAAINEALFKKRTKVLAIEVVALVNDLPRNRVADVLGKQLLRCATSVGANYRAACRGRSQAEMIAKLGIVEEEADEAIYWMELLIEAQIVSKEAIAWHLQEANELLAMTVASIKTLRTRTASLPANPKSGHPSGRIANPKSNEHH